MKCISFRNRAGRVISFLFIGILFCSFSPVRGNAQSPGKWTFESDLLISGEQTKMRLCYEHVGPALPAGAYHRVLLEPVSVKALLFCYPSEDLKVMAYGNEQANVKLYPRPVHGVGFREIVMFFPEGIKPGQSFAIEIGNADSNGEITGLVNPIPVHGLTFETYTGHGVDDEKKLKARGGGRLSKSEKDWQVMGWWPDLPKVTIEANRASRVRISAPSLVETGEKFKVVMSVTDDFDSRAFPAYSGDVFLECDGRIRNLPESVEYKTSNRCSRKVQGLSISRSGVYRIRARFRKDGPFFESNPIVVRENVTDRIYWGNIHNHDEYSECWGDGLDNFYYYARDISGMDFVSLSDHRGQIPVKGRGVGRLYRWRHGEIADSLEAWGHNIERANHYNSDDFVTLIGYEWSSMDSGHYNIYYANPTLANMDRIFRDQYIDFGFGMVSLLKKSDVLFIPHIHADVFPYRTILEKDNAAGKPLTPVIEVYSDWGEAFYPYGKWDDDTLYGGLRNHHCKSYLWALEQGYQLGAIGDSDSHTGMPGRRNPGGIAPWHRHPQGFTGVWTSDFTRDGIMKGYQGRSTYATTSARIFLEVKAGNAAMGDTLRTDQPFDIEVFVAGTDAIETVELYSGLRKVGEKTGQGKRDLAVTFENLTPRDRKRPYVVAVTQADENRAFSSPIWVQKTKIPELAFEKNSRGQVLLVNRGTGPAEDIIITMDAQEYPFAKEDIQTDYHDLKTETGMIWVEPRSNLETIFHFRWLGEDLSGEIEIEGCENYTYDYNRHFLMLGGKLDEPGPGIATFSMGRNTVRSKGFDVVASIVPDRPNRITLEFEREIELFVAGQGQQKTAKVTIDLNGRKNDKVLKRKVIQTLAPGDSVALSPNAGFYAVDPEDYILELDETNNLFRNR